MVVAVTTVVVADVVDVALLVAAAVAAAAAVDAVDAVAAFAVDTGVVEMVGVGCCGRGHGRGCRRFYSVFAVLVVVRRIRISTSRTPRHLPHTSTLPGSDVS